MWICIFIFLSPILPNKPFYQQEILLPESKTRLKSHPAVPSDIFFLAAIPIASEEPNRGPERFFKDWIT